MTVHESATLKQGLLTILVETTEHKSLKEGGGVKGYISNRLYKP